MRDKKFGIVFPAFGMKYKSFTPSSLPGYETELRDFLARASSVVDLDPTLLAPDQVDVITTDLQEHYVCYINSCVISELLKKHDMPSDYVAAYSMGLFAALYHVESVSFEDGLWIMHNVCEFAHEAVNGEQYGMAVVVGFTYDEVNMLIGRHCTKVAIADVCNEHVIIVAGKRNELDLLVQISWSQGSLHSKMLPVFLPYHSKFMHNVEAVIEKFLADLTIKQPTCPIVSCVDQTLLSTPDAVLRELACNMRQPINWAKTMQKMLDLGVNLFVECGLSKGLSKLSKFYHGDFEFYHPKKYSKLFMPERRSYPQASSATVAKGVTT